MEVGEQLPSEPGPFALLPAQVTAAAALPVQFWPAAEEHCLRRRGRCRLPRDNGFDGDPGNPAAGHGQHRNRALAAARQARAVELATRGMTYQAIADELGYSNRGTVYRLVDTALTRELQEDVEVHRRLEGDRLDALQVSLWEKAMAGDTAAAQQIIQIITTRCRLLGLDLRTKRSAGLAGSPPTVVVTEE